MSWRVKGALELEGRGPGREESCRVSSSVRTPPAVLPGCGTAHVTSPLWAPLLPLWGGGPVRAPLRGLGPLLSGVEHRAHAAAGVC